METTNSTAATTPTDADEYRQADHAIFTCRNCGYSTTDIYTAGVINDLSGECPECHLDADIGGIWCDDSCGWY